MKKKITMEVVNPLAAGIDVGSRSHFVSIGQTKEDVREFGVYTKDHNAMIEWLKKAKITTVAMESTGSYWQTLFSALQLAEFEVILVNGRDVKNVKGKKTDMLDCIWIQKLHSLGLLRGSYLPDEHTRELHTYCLYRQKLIEQSSKYINRIQKNLRLMNIRLDVAINDITGKTGSAILNAILLGERNPKTLSELADVRVKKSKEEIAKSLDGEWKDDLLYVIKDCWQTYQYYQDRIRDLDICVENTLKKGLNIIKKVKLPDVGMKQLSKNDPKFDLRSLAYQILGIDLYQIGGVRNGTVLTVLSTLGSGINKFPTSKHFVSWLRLAPNNKISGGKILSSRTQKGKNQLSISLRRAANAIGNTKTHPLKKFFSRIAYKKGRGAAITATARKLAVIIYRMLLYKEDFNPGLHANEERERLKKIIAVRKKVAALNLTDAEKGAIFT
ncbi:IS110 family transposase [Chondrinema litorale]|uniref:IS110 family transposase n=1 Tax=Chondrinema litorale TaxID=2994555 RepID=UPI002542A633|nr:IS110 family transposase [Chondrinema litorale]UZR97723.1 IS110 family transposase [Chondrinema litorale]UZR98234.1 IS110 family transposase [Chondrinema litorale]UZR99073.1 IS110 family transposase [Chondrinema litorale]UZR99079.1 IS110 family transposase [Chondrinema litorale]